jgi:hypothetical protein
MSKITRKNFIMSSLITIGITMVIIFIAVMSTRADTIFYKPGNIPFYYDVEEVPNKLLGGIESRAGVTIVIDVNCYDPDDDPFKVELTGSVPEGMYIQGHAHDPNEPSDFSEWKIYWTPIATQQEGVYYVHLKATDVPPVGNTAMTDTGTLVYKINPGNRPPELRPISVNMK